MAIDKQTSKGMTANFSKLSFRPNAAERVFLEQFAQRNGTTSVTQTLHMLIAECMDRGVGGWGSGGSGGHYSYPSANDRQIKVVMAGDNSSYFGQQLSSSSSFTPDSVNNNNFKHEYNSLKHVPRARPALQQQPPQQQLPQSVQAHAGTDTLDEQVSSMLFYIYNVLPRTNPPLASFIINGLQQTELKTQQIDMPGQIFLQQQQYQQSNQNMTNVSNSTAYPYYYQQQQQQYYAPAAQQYPAASLTPSSSAMMTPSLPQSTPTADNITQNKPKDFLDMAIETTEKTARLNEAMKAMYRWP